MTGKSPARLQGKLKVFGADAFYALPDSQRSKVGARAGRGVWIGYSTKQNAHRILIQGHKVITTPDVKVYEQSFNHMKLVLSVNDHDGTSGTSNSTQHSSSGLVDFSASFNDMSDTCMPVSSTSVNTTTATVISPPSTLPDAAVNINAASSSESASVPVHMQDGLVSDHDAIDIEINADNQPDTDAEPDSVQDGLELDMPDSAPAVDMNSSEDSKQGDAPASVSVDRSEVINATQPRARRRARVHPPVTELPVSRRSHRTIRPINRLGIPDLRDYDIDDQAEIANVAVSIPGGADLIEPTSYRQAMQHVDSDKWKMAMNEEIASIEYYKVYDLVRRPSDTNVINSRWVYKLKHDANNVPVRWKGRVVCKGFQQIYGIDYLDTFAPVTSAQSIKLQLSIAAQYNMDTDHSDFDTAFLNGELDTPIFMEQPEGYVIGAPGEYVWKLNKALYGLKQAPRVWNKKINGSLTDLGYMPIRCDPCIYVKKLSGHQPIIVSLYVDDMLAIFEPSLKHIWMNDKAKLGQQYRLTDLGKCKWVLNIAVGRDKRGITLCQNTYIDRMVERFDMKNCKPAHIPARDVILHAPPSDAKPLGVQQHKLYRSMIGGLLYAANITRIDIAYAVGMLSRAVAAPTTHHLVMAQQVLHYLYHTKDYKLCFKAQDQLELVIYADADHAGDTTDRKSTSGVLVRFNGNNVSWMSKKQTMNSLSSTESEYMSLTFAFKEACWFQTWVHEVLGVTLPVTVYSDSQSAIAMTGHEVHRNKHIDIRHHFLHDMIPRRNFSVKWIGTKAQLADILTKPLSRQQFEPFRDILLVKD